MKVLIFTQFWYRKKPCCISKISKYDILDSTRNGRSSWMICPCIWVLLNRSPSSTQLHPTPPSSFQLSPSSIDLHPAHFSLHPALCNTLNIVRTKISHLGNFPKFRPKNSNLSILTGNWHTWYLGGGDSESKLRFLKFQAQNQFLGKSGPKKSKLFVLPENSHTWFLEDADFYCDISFLNFQP